MGERKSRIFERTNGATFYPRTGIAKGTKLITRSGIVFLDLFWTRASTYRNPFVFLRTLGIAILSIIKRKASRIPDDLQLGVIHSIWTAGYYHWITESLPRAWVMKKEFPEAVPILPSLKYENYEKSLNLIGFDQVKFFPEGENTIINNPIMTECSPRFGTTSPKLLEEVRDCIFTNLGISPDIIPSKIIYVSRKKARGRKVLNERDVIDYLGELGAEVVCFEDLTFSEQVRLMAETRLLISIHGAALTNMIFMPRGGGIIEFLPEKNGIFDYNMVRNSFKHDSCFLKLASAMGHTHQALVSPADNKPMSGTHMANIDVNIAELTGILGLENIR